MIVYQAGYKYQLNHDYTIETGLGPFPAVDDHDFLKLTPDGVLTIRDGYAWDGPSGPTIDTLNFMRGSLVHDAFYQLMREGYIPEEKWRKEADKLLRKICLEDGMSQFRAWYVYQGVRFGGDPSARPQQKKLIYAPTSEGCPLVPSTQNIESPSLNGRIGMPG